MVEGVSALHFEHNSEIPLCYGYLEISKNL